MEPYQTELIAEYERLTERIKKLGQHIEAGEHVTVFEALPVDEQMRMERQHNLMQQLSDVMRERIEAFGVIQ